MSDSNVHPLQDQYNQLLAKHYQLMQVLAALVTVYGKEIEGCGSVATIPLTILDAMEETPFTGISLDDTGKYMLVFRPNKK